MLHHLDIECLRTFVFTVDSGSVVNAAERLFLTQSAVSMRLKRLEVQLDRQLLRKVGRKLSITHEGTRLLLHARRMLQYNDQIWADMTGPDYEGEINIGVPPDIIMPHLPLILEQMSLRWPKLHPIIETRKTLELMEMMDKGKLDILLGTLAWIPESAEIIASSSLVWVSDLEGKAIKKRPLPLSCANNCSFIKPLLSHLDDAKVPWVNWIELEDEGARLALVRKGLCTVVLMREFVDDSLSCYLGPEVGLPALGEFHIILMLQTNNPKTYIKGVAQLFRNAYSTERRLAISP